MGGRDPTHHADNDWATASTAHDPDGVKTERPRRRKNRMQ